MKLQTSSRAKLEIDSISSLTPKGFSTHYLVKGRMDHIFKFINSRLDQKRSAAIKTEIKNMFKAGNKEVQINAKDAYGIKYTLIRI